MRGIGSARGETPQVSQQQQRGAETEPQTPCFQEAPPRAETAGG